MKIESNLYPVIIITTLVLFTILGFALGFLPEHNSGDDLGRLPAQVVVTSLQFENI